MSIGVKRDYKLETEKRVAFIKEVLADSGAGGIVFGNSGGKDSALVGILAKLATENTVGVMLPASSGQNYGRDLEDARLLAYQYGIESLYIDLSASRDHLIAAVEAGLVGELGQVREDSGGPGLLTDQAISNIAPRLRMTALYAIAQSRGYLVAGTSNASERYLGYFTKWGDGGVDFNPIADLTVREIYEFLEYLGAPGPIIDKAPSAGLYEGQTDEGDLGITYEALDAYLLEGKTDKKSQEIIDRHHQATEHKRQLPLLYADK